MDGSFFCIFINVKLKGIYFQLIKILFCIFTVLKTDCLQAQINKILQFKLNVFNLQLQAIAGFTILINSL